MNFTKLLGAHFKAHIQLGLEKQLFDILDASLAQAMNSNLITDGPSLQLVSPDQNIAALKTALIVLARRESNAMWIEATCNTILNTNIHSIILCDESFSGHIWPYYTPLLNTWQAKLR